MSVYHFLIVVGVRTARSVRSCDSLVLCLVLGCAALGQCQNCVVEPCNSATILLPAAGFDAACAKANQISLLGQIANDQTCKIFLLERMCKLFELQSEAFAGSSCSAPVGKLCADECDAVAQCIVNPTLFDCPGNTSPDGECTVLPPPANGAPDDPDFDPLPPINETRFTGAYDVAVLGPWEDNLLLNHVAAVLFRAIVRSYELAIDDINRTPSVLPHTKLRLQFNETLGGWLAVGLASGAAFDDLHD